jgi:hypothetical protein
MNRKDLEGCPIPAFSRMNWCKPCETSVYIVFWQRFETRAPRTWIYSFSAATTCAVLSNSGYGSYEGAHYLHLQGWWRQHVSPKRPYPSTSLHSVITHENHILDISSNENLRTAYTALLYEEASVNGSQRDTKHKTYEIRTRKRNTYSSTYPPSTLTHLCHRFISTSKPAG